MPIPITALYAGVMGLILFALDFHVGSMRGRKKISVYDAGDREMAIAVRRQGNFTEHVPLALILLAVLELSGAPALGLHLIGGGLTVARIAHPFGLDYDVPSKPARVVGAALTALVTVVASIWAIWTFVS
jgi:uncharacterized membrane protein YecN with MAPEG domain